MQLKNIISNIRNYIKAIFLPIHKYNLTYKKQPEGKFFLFFQKVCYNFKLVVLNLQALIYCTVCQNKFKKCFAPPRLNFYI